MKKSYIEYVLDFINSNTNTPHIAACLWWFKSAKELIDSLEYDNSRLYTSTFVLQNSKSEDVIIVCSADGDFSKASLTYRYISAKYNLEILDPDLADIAPRIFIV